ncbi:MAG: phytanoyl-CoA dioxygenase family protein [Caulobacteraceae bacterium]|nr:phytanoyl-CoA dioxygenase family protein [Caulobacteraceae bacterium]
MEPTPHLTPETLAAFERDGLARLPAALPATKVAVMADRVWRHLAERLGADRARPETWPSGRIGGFQALERSGACAACAPLFTALADRLLGPGQWIAPRHWGQALITFPEGAWAVPHAMWHLDLPAMRAGEPLAGVRLFTFLEPVEPRGGGTLVLAGSHRAVMDRAAQEAALRLRSAEMRQRLAADEPWMADLLSAGGPRERFMGEDGALRGHPVRVAELTGAPGDVVIMHPAAFHTLAPNGRERPRMMLVQALARRG